MILAAIALAVVAPAAASERWVAVPTDVNRAEVNLGGMTETAGPNGAIRVAALRTYNAAIAAMRVERTIAFRCVAREWRITRIKSYIAGKSTFRDEAVPDMGWQSLDSAAVVAGAAKLVCAEPGQ